jgi:diadenylate cyclase
VFQDISISDLIDVVFMSLLIYIVLVWFKKTKAAFVLTGIVIVAAVYLLAQQFNLFLTAGVLQGFFAVILLAMIIIFQEEIRRFFEQIALWSMNPRFRKQQKVRPAREEAEILVRTLIDLAREKIGALVVLRGENMILRHLSGGMELGGKLSEPLLKSIFDPHSPGHDGAVVIDNNRIDRFGTYLPLSKNFKKLKQGGTRHAAGLGLTEMSDALCIIVSEERGKISVARHGDIHEISDAESLLKDIDHFYKEFSSPAEKIPWWKLLRRDYREEAVAVGLALMLWFVHVHGSQVVYKTLTVPVDYAELPADLSVVESTPKEVAVTFSGPRRYLYFLGKGKVKLFLKTLYLHEGKQSIRITHSDLSFPQNVNLEDVNPDRVAVDIMKK